MTTLPYLTTSHSHPDASRLLPPSLIWQPAPLNPSRHHDSATTCPPHPPTGRLNTTQPHDGRITVFSFAYRHGRDHGVAKHVMVAGGTCLTALAARSLCVWFSTCMAEHERASRRGVAVDERLLGADPAGRQVAEQARLRVLQVGEGGRLGSANRTQCGCGPKWCNGKGGVVRAHRNSHA
jgi:hypothetical protein